MMLIGCISEENPEKEIAIASELCDGLELRGSLSAYRHLAQKPIITGVVDYHNYERTPDDLSVILDELREKDAAFYKIATFANSSVDALKMLLFTRAARRKGIPFAGMCMGPKGAITRILAPFVDASLTYASIGLPTSPGQLPAVELLTTYRFREMNPKTEICWGMRKMYHAGMYLKLDIEPNEVEEFTLLANELGLTRKN